MSCKVCRVHIARRVGGVRALTSDAWEPSGLATKATLLIRA